MAAMMATTMMAANRYDHEFSVNLAISLKYAVAFSRFHCCGHHGIPCGRHGLWPSWFVAVMVCGRHGLWPSWSRPFSNCLDYLCQWSLWVYLFQFESVNSRFGLIKLLVGWRLLRNYKEFVQVFEWREIGDPSVGDLSARFNWRPSKNSR